MWVFNNTSHVIHQNPPPMEEDEFNLVKKYDKFFNVITALQDLSVGLAVVLCLIGVLLFLTILNSKLRNVSAIWYYYHLIAICVVTGLVIHTFFNGYLHGHSKGFCVFLMYTLEYFYFAVGMNMVLMNIEIYFTTVLPLQKWQWNPFMRFIITILIMWNATGVLVAYITVDNNAAKNYPYGCFFIRDKSIRQTRQIFQYFLPAILCFICTIVLIGTHCLKRSRFMITSASGELREVNVVTNEGEMEWTRMAVFMNFVFVVRCVIVLVLKFVFVKFTLETYVAYISILVVHSVTLYLLPLGLLFVHDARAVLKAIIFKAIALVSCGKVRLGEDLEQLSVSFGQDTGTTVH